jgi:uracil-DNA glycosylase
MQWLAAVLCCVTGAGRLKSPKMAKDNIDIRKVARQAAETDDYFTGFSVKGKARPVAAAVEVAAGALAPVAGTPEEELASVAADVRKCCRCILGGTRKNPVPGEGNPHARLVFVGEAPGADEDEQGRPFVGRAGQLLEKMITAMGLQRREVFICNTLKCRPPDNRDPRPEEIVKCLPFLRRQLAAIKPEIVVALGAHAAHTLLSTEDPIGRLRGKFHDCQLLGEDGPVLRVMPTYHPAYLLRNYSDDNRRRVWEDLQKVMAELGLPAKK